ncbi:MAG: hypothetical protein ACOY5S_14010 [Pseudomonadota bacterium]
MGLSLYLGWNARVGSRPELAAAVSVQAPCQQEKTFLKQRYGMKERLQGLYSPAISSPIDDIKNDRQKKILIETMA